MILSLFVAVLFFSFLSSFFFLSPFNILPLFPFSSFPLFNLELLLFNSLLVTLYILHSIYFENEDERIGGGEKKRGRERKRER